MSYLIRMIFYVQHTDDGLVHVQNTVMGRLGQHHVHSEKGFEVWKKNVSAGDLEMLATKSCNCGLKPGDVREYDGAISHRARFE